MAILTQGNTRTEVGGADRATSSPNQAVDFTELVKLGTAVLETKTKDNTAALLNKSITSYATGLDALREQRGAAFGNADISRYNNKSMQEFMVNSLSQGVAVKDLNSAVTAFKNAQESNQQYVSQSEGGWITKTDGNGESTSTVDPNYGKQLQIRLRSEWDGTKALYMNELEKSDPVAFGKIFAKEVSMAHEVDALNQLGTLRAARLENMKTAKLLTAEENEAQIQESKRGRQVLFHKGSQDTLQLLRTGQITKEQALNNLTTSYKSLMLNPEYIKEQRIMGVDAFKQYDSSVQLVLQDAQRMVAAADPQNELTREAMAQETIGKIFDAESYNAMPSSVKIQAAWAKRLEGVASATMMLKVLDKSKLSMLIMSHNDTVREVVPVLTKTIEAGASPEDFNAGINYLERSLAMMKSEYNALDTDGEATLPVIMPEEAEAIVNKLFTSNNYQTMATPEQKTKHQRMLIAIRKNYPKDPRFQKTLDGLVKEVEGTGIWAKFFGSSTTTE